MLVRSAHCYRYTLPLTAPLQLGEQTIEERQGLLLSVCGVDGRRGWGEAAPLPGFSEETTEEASTELVRLASILPGTELSAPRNEPYALVPQTDLSSVRFAAESALLELVAHRRGRSVAEVLGSPSRFVQFNALITDDETTIETAAERYRAAGYEAVKLKVGRRPIVEDARRIQTARRALPDELSLRLDANRAWTFDQAVAFAEAVRDVSFSYVEEPLRNPDRLSELVETTGLPVALDETTREMAMDDLNGDVITAVVLKPTLLGGVRAVSAWAGRARVENVVSVVSASYESGIGLRMLVALAAVLTTAPAGLSTYTRLETDVLQPRLPLDGPTVQADSLYSATVDSASLSSIAQFE